jgi:hypothetical protein
MFASIFGASAQMRVDLPDFGDEPRFRIVRKVAGTAALLVCPHKNSTVNVNKRASMRGSFFFGVPRRTSHPTR